MPKPDRSYGQGCIGAHALDLVGDRWALLIVRELMLGPRRFGAIRANLHGIATNVLTARLDQLESAGVAKRVTLPEPANVPAYALTQAGLDLWPVLHALCNWGGGMPGHDHRLPISPSSLMLSMKAQILPLSARAGGDREAAFRLGEESFLVTVRDGRHNVIRDPDPQAEIGFVGTPNDVAPAIYGPWRVADYARSANITVTGDPARLQGFVDLYSLDPSPERTAS